MNETHKNDQLADFLSSLSNQVRSGQASQDTLYRIAEFALEIQSRCNAEQSTRIPTEKDVLKYTSIGYYICSQLEGMKKPSSNDTV